MTNQKENSKPAGETQNAANTQNPKTGNQQGAPGKTDNDTDVDQVETSETENSRTEKNQNQTGSGRRDDIQNDPTRIRPGVNESGKTDPTGTDKQNNRK